MRKMEAIKAADLSRMSQNYLKNDKARAVRNALTANDLKSISRTLEGEAENPHMFSIDIETMPATNQMASGRCWIFSSMNVLREIIAKKYHISSFELSQNYIAFYDKLEKINFLMETVLSEIDTPLSSETMRYVLQTGIGDGGQWDMLVSIVKKYGICPKTAMPETYQSSHTAAMNSLLNQRLRRFAAETKKIAGKPEELKKAKQECLQECYGLLCSCFGVPPKTFTFEFRDVKKQYHAYHNVTPMQFYKQYLKVDLDEYVGIINGPTADKPFHKMYTVKYLGNAVDGNPVSFLNLPMNEFKAAVLKQMKDGNLVWFGCDCGKDADRVQGLWSDSLFDYASTFDMQLDMSKAEMLDSWESAMNHAMVLTGVNLVKNKPNRWKIENSWGEKAGNKGYYTASDTWFDKYVYEAVVNKKYLTAEQKKCLSLKPRVLNPWDPFGSLAD